MSAPKTLGSGPWKAKYWDPTLCYIASGEVTREEVIALVAAAPDTKAMAAAVGADNLTDGRASVATRLAKAAGLLVYRDRKWIRVEGGES